MVGVAAASPLGVVTHILKSLNLGLRFFQSRLQSFDLLSELSGLDLGLSGFYLQLTYFNLQFSDFELQTVAAGGFRMLLSPDIFLDWVAPCPLRWLWGILSKIKVDIAPTLEAHCLI